MEMYFIARDQSMDTKSLVKVWLDLIKCVRQMQRCLLSKSDIMFNSMCMDPR